MREVHNKAVFCTLPSKSAFTAEREPLCKPRILLVEDNPTNRLLLSDYLTHLGYSVMALESGNNFFAKLEQFQPHLILLDLKLPGIDGYALLQEMRQNCLLNHIPIVVVSAYAFKADQQRALRLGARDYLVKPINLNALHQTIIDNLH